MSVIPDNIRSQLAPGWSGVNIAIMVVLLIFMFPLGVLMIGYILLGDALGVDLGRPETFATLFRRIGRAFDAGMTEFNGQANGAPAVNTEPTTTQTDPVSTDTAHTESREAQNLQAQRENLDAERRRFEAEKAAFYQRRDGQGEQSS
jgi:hypothetical protein